MRHKLNRHRINRFTSWRKATEKSLVRSLFIYQSIKTTKAKALVAKSLADKLISLAKEDTLAGRRKAFSVLGDHALVQVLFNDIAKRYKAKVGGYTRMLALGSRRGDSAEMVILELTEIKKKVVRARKPKKDEPLDAEHSSVESEGAGGEDAKEEKSPEVKGSSAHEKPSASKKPNKNFLGGLRSIFKKERDSL
jgi:large subunit ribosomal protein L17